MLMIRHCVSRNLCKVEYIYRRNCHILNGPVPLNPIEEGTAGQQLFDALTRFRHLPAVELLAETRQRVSYKELLERSCRLACNLQKHGLGRESTISIFSENSIYYYYTLLASLFLGITVAPINADYKEYELRHVINISKPKTLFCSQATLERALTVQKDCSFVEEVVLMDSTTLRNDVQTLNDFMDSEVNVARFVPVDFNSREQVAFILCSSGTTGLPKGVMITHRNLSVRFAQMKDPIIGLSDEIGTTTLSVFPMSHIGGLGLSLSYLILGFHNRTMKQFSFKQYLQLIQDCKIKTSFISPPVMVLLAKSPLVKIYNLSSLKEIHCGAAPLSEEIMIEVLKRIPSVKEVRQGYGLTETTLTVTFSPKSATKIGSSGQLYPYNSAKVTDIKTGNALEAYRQGELCFKGETIMKGYVGNLCATEDVIDRDGWFYTGDIGYYDDDDHFYVVDRLKDLIKYKGYQVSPAELERLLLKHPKVEDAAVVGVEDEVAGQLPRAYVVKNPCEDLSAEEIVNYVAGQVSPQKHLRAGVIFLDEIPKISSGKIDRMRLRELTQKINRSILEIK